jgi:hypothetical protein
MPDGASAIPDLCGRRVPAKWRGVERFVGPSGAIGGKASGHPEALFQSGASQKRKPNVVWRNWPSALVLSPVAPSISGPQM